MASADSPGSPLSEHGSDEFEDEVKLDDRDDLEVDEEDDIDLPTMPPAKKLKTGPGPGQFRATPQPSEDLMDGDISSDTEGEAPSSPGGPSMAEEGDADQQVTVCRWRGCQAGDMGNMDELVKHIHDVHIGSRQKKYACEWEGCTRIDATHASGYALRAHMRSHTREKPFYCALPECDKAFTRSDALAKHMRTVHETEALRPSDPVPRHHSSLAAARQPKLKLVFGKKGADGTGGSGSQLSPDEQALQYVLNNEGYPASCDFGPEELAMSPRQLYARLKLFVKWAEEEGEQLKLECEQLEQLRYDEWQEKHLVLTNVIEGTLAVEVSQATEDRPHANPENAQEIVKTLLPERQIPMQREEQCFWRHMDDGSVASIEGAVTAAAANGVKSEMDVDKS